MYLHCIFVKEQITKSQNIFTESATEMVELCERNLEPYWLSGICVARARKIDTWVGAKEFSECGDAKCCKIILGIPRSNFQPNLEQIYFLKSAIQGVKIQFSA